MATAVLKLTVPAATLTGYDDAEVVKQALVPMMSFPREVPPPQLPQIPADLWAEVWDDLMAVMVEDILQVRALQKLLPLNLCICCCGPCIVMPKMMQAGQDQMQRWAALVQKVQPKFSPIGVGVSLHEEIFGHGGSVRKCSSGLRFDGAVMAGVGAPVQVQVMGVVGN
mmetsp:Transcript_37246/g.75136  ORF Transcript_37246/g.75136 Transcript_37246/m.75136 type:complete len:168 (-) Transcript_37246:199-702(-)